MRSASGGLRRAFMADKLRSVGGSQLSEEREQRIIEWDTTFRYNWDIYAEFFLGISLKPYQREALHEIGVSDSFFWRAGRNGAKSFVTGLAGLIKILLYPNCFVVITASTVDQANKIVSEKIEREIIKKLSPYLLYLYENDWIKITKPTDGYRIENTLNNSVLTVLAPVESARGTRSNFTIYDEVAVMKKAAIDEIFEGMLYPRQPVYLNKYPEYANNPRWLEESKSVYLTSSKFKYQWWYKEWKNCVKGYYTDKVTRYNVFASDYFDNIDNGLKTWGDFKRAKARMNDMAFRMEMLNEAVGETEDAFFSLKSFKENQILEKCFRPPTLAQLYTQQDLGNKPKEDDEIRLIISDFAFANTTSKEKNDNTIILFMSLHWKKNRFERHVDYLEGYPASDSLGAADRVRALIYDYNADYYILDLRNGGEVLYNYITMPKQNEERGRYWNVHGLGLATKYQIVQQGKLDDLRERTVDKTPIQCVIPVTATGETNSVMWASLKKQLECNNIKFLISMEDKQTLLENNGEYFSLSSEELAEKLLPYGQIDLLIQEAVSLKAEFKNDKIKLIEQRSGYKDRAIVLSYGNYIADLIENEWNKQAQTEEIDVSQIQLVW